MATCSKIASEILYGCTDMVAGIKDLAYFINIDDLDKDTSTFDPDNPLLLTQIALAAGTAAFRVEGHNYSNEHDTALVKKTYYNSWEHNFRFRVFDNTPAIKDWINTAVKSRFAIVIENNTIRYSNVTSPAGSTVFEVLGWDFGLEIKEAVRTAGDQELAGGWNILAACGETMKESKPPLALFVGGSLTATRAAVAALLGD